MYNDLVQNAKKRAKKLSNFDDSVFDQSNASLTFEDANSNNNNNKPKENKKIKRAYKKHPTMLIPKF